MENLYFPLFLVAIAVVVIWLFKGAGKKRPDRTPVRRTSVSRDIGATGRRSTGRHVPASGTRKPHDPWQLKRERAAQERFTAGKSGSAQLQANYIGPAPKFSSQKGEAGNLKDQEISHTEHLGIDEYFSKVEREKRAKEKKAAEQDGLTMTAVKYQSVDESEASEDVPAKEQGGFKP